MPVNLNEIFKPPETQANYPNKPQTTQEQVNEMPNSEKLTSFERGAYNILPKVAPLAKSIEWINNTPVGKVLSYFDVLAEGTERALGFGYQVANLRPEDEFDVKSAWNAGTMFYDTLNMPHWNAEEGLVIPADLPGPAVLAEMRKKLASGADMNVVKEEYYGSLGALALRAQMQDMWGHIVLDPLNFILPQLKLVERTKAIAEFASLSKVDVSELVQLEKIARTTGNIAEADKLASAVAKVGTGEIKGYTALDKFAIFATGADVEKIRAFDKFNPFALTPESKASEVTSMVVDHAGAYIVKPHWGDPEGMVKAIEGVAKGGVGDEFGHAFLTKPGRAVQAQASGWAIAARQELNVYNTFKGERAAVQKLATSIGETSRNFLKMAETDAATLAQRLAANGVPMPEQELEKLAGLLKNVPIAAEEFSAKMAIKLEDITMQQAIVQFGVKERGFITRWSNAVKAAESLVFIKLNPTNTIRNAVNNTMTLVARGGFGTWTTSMITDFWKGEGYIPPRAIQAFNLGLDELGQSGKAGEILSAALNPKVSGAPEKIKNWFGKIEGLSKYSAKAEESASIRAFTVGYTEAARNYVYSSLKNHLDPSLAAQLENEFPGIAKAFDNIAKDSLANSAKFKEAIFKELEFNASSVMDEASDILGNKVDDFLDTETLNRITRGLPDAIKNKKVPEFMSQMKNDMESHLDDMFQKNMDDLAENVAQQVEVGGPKLFYKHLGNAIDEVRGSHTEDAIRMSQFDEVIKGAREAKDYERAGQIWEKLRSDRDKFYGRMWNKFDTYLKGMERGAKKAGITMSPDIRSAFKEIKKGWSDFHKFKESEWNAVFEAIKAKKPAKSYDEVQDLITHKFDEMVEIEDAATAKVDDLLASSMPPEQAQIFREYRDLASQMHRADKEFTSEFWVAYRQAPKEQKAQLLAQYWRERIQRVAQIRDVEKMGSAALQGDAKGIQDLQVIIQGIGEKPAEGTIYDIANQFGIPSATASGGRNDRRILNTVNKYSETPFKNVADIPEDVARKAFETRAAEKGISVKEQSFMPDVERVIPDIDPLESKIQQFTYGRQYSALDAIEESAKGAKTGTLLKNLPPQYQKGIEQWANKVQGEMGDARYFATRMGEFKRDSALLNYNRRTNFDAWAGNMVPFGFWTTHSALNWAVHSLDRPAMLSTYLRMRQFLDTAGLQDENAPSRLRRNIKINLPFVPDWMGSQFVDPLKLAFPFDAWLAPFERNIDMTTKADGRADRVLDAMLQSGEISQEDYQLAKTSKTGPGWDRALQKVQTDDPNMKFDAFDFGTMLMSPHAPLMWAYNAAKGTPQDIGPFTPMSRTFRDVATVLGVKDWNNSPMNLEAKVRKSLGLPAFDKWDDYRTDRMLSNMAGDAAMGKSDFTIEEIQRAMVERSGPIYEEAVSRANQEFTGGPLGAALRLIGLPIKSYPEGEETQRALQDDFSRAYEAYNQADQNANEGKPVGFNGGDPDALTEFFEEHPEYETRLGLWDKPEERMRKFLIDQTWAQYNSFPDLNKREIREQLGGNFDEIFLNKETRAYDSISVEQMQVWIKLMGGDPVGTLSAEQKTLMALYDVDLTPAETAWRVEVFFDDRKELYPNYFEMQEEYYAQPANNRRPSAELKAYWGWRRDWMNKNPDLVPYLTDNERDLEKAKYAERIPEIAVPTQQEIMVNMSDPMRELIAESGSVDNLPPAVLQTLSFMADQYGLTEEQMYGIVGIQ